MYTASALRRTNIAEYLLYMWQVEDLIRANGLDLDRLAAHVINPVPDLDDDRRKQLREWYESLIDMMRREEVTEKGHLQINRNTLSALEELHRELLADPEARDYQAEYYRTLPIIVELRAKGGDTPAPEIETCFNALYGLLMLRLQKREMSEATQRAMAQISRQIALLARAWRKREEEEQGAGA